MKKSLSFVRTGLVVMGILVTALLFTACRKTTDVQNTPLAKLMAFNLAPDQNQAVISLSGNSITPAPLGFTVYTGGYLDIYPGTRQIQTFDYNSNMLITSGSFIFDMNRYYSFFLTGNNGVYTNIAVADNIDSLSATNGQAYIRYINAVPDSSNPTVTVTANGANVISKSSPYTTVSAFVQVPPGDVTINISNETNIQATRTITLAQQKVYTILLVGLPAPQSDPNKSVQIRFIENGQLSP